ncbi:MAG: hypothetical protein SFW63_07525 [Alphaproteobacteria bacterium]|nr:hypothetical protein [Alphaproteobacteria bacterium]
MTQTKNYGSKPAYSNSYTESLMTMLSTIDLIIKQNSTSASEIHNANNTQHSYSFADNHEAKIFFDVLTACGFEVKLYRESSASKLHVGLPKKRLALPDGWQHAAESQIKLALVIKNNIEQQIKHGDAESDEFSLSITPLPSGGHQMIIHLPKSPATATFTQAQPAVINDRSAAPPQGLAAKKLGDIEDNSIYSGPDVMNQPGINLAKLMKIDESQDTLWRRIKLYVKGNIFYTMLVLVGCFVGLIVFISFFVLSKAVLCPDFAHIRDKNPPWYCTYK